MSLGKHKYYCEMCQRQCKDENAFKQHKRSSQHQQNMIQFNENPEYFIEKFSEDFDRKFQDMFRIKFGTQSFMQATKAYNEYIRDPYHTHMNSTRWTTLAEYVQYLQEIGKFEVRKEVVGDTEQAFIRLIDQFSEKKDVGQKQSKESLRELEKKREQKELDKMIKKANKLVDQQKQSGIQLNKQPDIFHKPQGTTNLITFETSQLSQSIPQKQENQTQNPKKRFAFGGNDDNDDDFDITKLQKGKQSNLDKILEHSVPQPKQRQLPLKEEVKQHSQPVIHDKIDKSKEEIPVQKPQWVYMKGMIVKVKKDGQYYKQKGEVIEIKDKHHITIKLPDQTLTFQEGELDKVLPSEGGKVVVISLNKTGIIEQIDMHDKEVHVRFDDGTGDKIKVRISDVCKINQ